MDRAVNLIEFENYWVFLRKEDFIYVDHIYLFYRVKNREDDYIRVFVNCIDDKICYTLCFFDKYQRAKYVEYNLTEEQARICCRQWGGDFLEYQTQWVSYSEQSFEKGPLSQDNSFRHTDRFRTRNVLVDIQVISHYCSYHKEVRYSIYLQERGKYYSEAFSCDLSEEVAKLVMKDFNALVDFSDSNSLPEAVLPSYPPQSNKPEKEKERRGKEDIMEDLKNALFLLQKKCVHFGYNSDDNPQNEDLRIDIDSLEESIFHLFEEMGGK